MLCSFYSFFSTNNIIVLLWIDFFVINSISIKYDLFRLAVLVVNLTFVKKRLKIIVKKFAILLDRI